MSALFVALLGLATTATSGAPVTPPVFVDATAESGLAFRHEAFWSPDKHLPETMGAGLVLFDFDGDGDLDIYFVQGVPAAGPQPGTAAPGNELWRNEGGLRFTLVPEAAGAADRGLGQGACAGDVDGDGDPDLYVTNVGPDRLYLNDGGRFRQAPLAGTAPDEDLWSSSCAFGDFDGDGALDLYVARYVDWHPRDKNPECGEVAKKLRSYCHPDVFRGVRDLLLLGDGKGGFRDATLEAGLERSNGKGLGVLACDVDLDGDLDIVVANDSTPNFLWINDGKGRFQDKALLKGLALNERGETEAGMGVVAGDVNSNGHVDVFMTHLDLETNTLWLQDARGRFRDASAPSGLGPPSLGRVGFGVEMLDFDLDGDLDVVIANGHVIDNIVDFNSALTWAQAPQLMLNDGEGRFQDASEGRLPSALLVGRGLAAGDLDGDFDLDLVLTSNGGPALLLRNELPERPVLVLELVATGGHREAQGARIEVRPLGAAEESPPLSSGELIGARSYASQGTLLLHLAAPEGLARVTVHWPGRASEIFSGLSRGRHRLVEGSAAGSGAGGRNEKESQSAP